VAVRRGDTFPGLSSDHVRVAVRSTAQVQELVRGLTAALAEVAA
jgi:histidinol-phosphate aminotransferase